MSSSLLSGLSQSRDPKAWDSIILSQAKLKNDEAVLQLYAQMKKMGVIPDRRSLPLVLKACTQLGAVEMGIKVHSDILRMRSLAGDLRIRTALIHFYSKCGLVEEARQVLEETKDRDAVSWNAIICGYASACYYEDAVQLFRRMQSDNLTPTPVTLVGLLLACGELLQLRLGQEIHCYCLKRGMHFLGPHLATSLITFYSKFHHVTTSFLVFDSMLIKNTVTWNSIISSYFQAGDPSQALRLFLQMLLNGIQPGSVAVLVAIQSSDCLHLGKQLHQLAIKFCFSTHLFIVNALLKMYAKNEDVESSRKLFETVPVPTRDTAMWNGLLSAYKECGYHAQVFALFRRMRSYGATQDLATITIVLSAISESAHHLHMGRGLHAYVIKARMELDASLGNALLRIYSLLNCVESAQKLFDQTDSSEVVCWNNFILVLARCKMWDQLLDLFQRLRQLGIRPNSFTMVSLLPVCQDETCRNIGRSIHGYVVRHELEFNLSLCTALVDMYTNCGDEAAAQHIFQSYPNKDLVSWNAMISCYVDNNRHNEAVLVFRRMLNEMEPNSVTIISILASCAYLANLHLGRSLHAYALRRELALNSQVSTGNALVTMYARCGSLKSAQKVFKSLLRRDVISWNAIIAAYGMHGCGKAALAAFSHMKKDGLTPTSVTFVSVLSACSHSGLIQEGWKYFYSMTQDYNITPEVVHYACMVDLLGRGGLLDEAIMFIASMPIEPDASVWRALLSACRVHSDAKLARTVFKKLVELEPMNIGNYVLLSNIYAAGGLWEEVRNLRREGKDKKLAKPPGKSWIAIRSQVHRFTAADTSHPDSDRIYAKLNVLMTLIKKNGYVPDRRWVLQDIKDEEKEQRLLSHSEKLAIAFGLLNVKGRTTPILVNKNLRVCGDCHTFCKYVSKCLGRAIVLRDASRFHHFVNGVCSCNDYW